MEKIVTKIGDVTIERRVSKPQQQTLGLPQQLQSKLTTKFDPSLPQHFSKQQELPIINKNVTIKSSSGGSIDLSKSELQNVKLHQSGPSLSPASKFETSQKQTVTINKANGPDLSKLVGISIERKKKVQPESLPAKFDNTVSIPPVVSIQKVSPQNVNKEEENEILDDDFEESLEEEDIEEDELIPLDADEPPPEMDISEGKPELDVSSVQVKKEKQEEPDAEVEEQAIKQEKMESVIKEEPLVKEEEEEPKGEVGDLEADEEIEDSKDSDINELACTDLVELMQKGEIEGEIEDVKDEEMDESDDKKEMKQKSDEEEGEDEEEKEEGDSEEGPPAKKKKKKKAEGDEKDEEKEEKSEGEEDGDKNIDKSKITNANLRKNIREVMDETKLDEATLAAQRQEAERLKRLQEQQRIIREVQRQIALNRQSQKTQNKVLSLLQGNSQTSILKTSSTTTQAQGSQAKNQNSVLVKLSNGEQTSLNNKKMLELLKNSKSKTVIGKPQIAKNLIKQGMVTPSVTIAPISKKEPVEDDKKKKKGDVVTLSSDSEDDCIVLSDDEESEPEEDPTNSGMHTNDKYNLPDEKGRVVVNVGHPESESDLYLAPQIARIIKPHQIGGIRFLYDNVIESIERFKNSAGFGCILAHSMGLGKTLQIVSFSDIFLRYTTARTILCIMPINTIQNWLAEFNMWLPKESSSEEVRCRDFDLFIVNESLKNINSRARVILEWQKTGGVLLMGYELFRLLSLKKSYKSKKKKKDPEEEDARHKELIEEVYSALVIPGPDLVICDEGHRIKNSHATTSQALKQIRTKRRIVLTGYPLQNNLLEYWCMVDFVRPNYLGTKTEFSNMFERPIQNGQCIDSTPQDKRLMRYRAHVLHSLLEGFVQRRSHAVLQSTLPDKEEYVLLLRFTSFQRKLYDTFMNEVVRTVAVPNPLKAFAVCCKIWNHPDVLYNFLKKKGEEIDLDLEEALPPSLQIPQSPYGQQFLTPENMNQQGFMPGTTPWPRRGPGSRGGKVKQAANRKAGRGRKPAASIYPNVASEKTPQDNDNFNSGHYPPNENFPNQQEGIDNFQNRNYSQSQFGFRNDYSNPTGGYQNPNYNKNPINNLENMSTNTFQNKSFFQQQNTVTNQSQYGNQNFDSRRPETNFNPNNSNDSNLNSSFESNINSSDSNFNQNDFSQDYSPDFYSNNNYTNPGSNANFAGENKNTGFQGHPYYQNSNNFDYQSNSTNINQNFQNFQNSNSNSNFPNNSGSNFQGANQGVPRRTIPPTNNFQNTNQSTNFQDSNPSSSNSFQANFQRQNSNFEGSSNTQNYLGQNTNFNRAGNFQNQNQTSFQEQSQRSFQNQGQSQGVYQGQNQRGVQPQSQRSFDDQNQGNYQEQNQGNFPGQNRGNFQGQNQEPNQGNFPGQNRGNFQGQNQEPNQGNFPGQNRGNFQGQNQEQNQGNFPGQNRGNFQGQSQEQSQGSFQGNNFEQGFWSQPSWGYAETSKGSQEFQSSNTTSDFLQQYEDAQDVKEEKVFPGGSSNAMYDKKDCDFSNFAKTETEKKYPDFEENKEPKPKEEEEEKKEESKASEISTKKDDLVPYDWATDLFKTYVTGVIENSSKMEVFFHIVTESIKIGDRLLVFSQSLLTLDLIEDYLHRQNVPDKEEVWAKNKNYFRLDGSTPGLEREKLINEFNSNPNVYLFLVSTRAGSLGINLVGANRVVVFDASWNPCHDTQAVCRVYRYGQSKPCFVYRLVMDSCLEKKIYDRQVNKQGMADRVVDELNPDAHLSIKEVTNLCWDDQEDTAVKDFSNLKDNYNDPIIKVLLEHCSKLLSKEPFQHESLLIDRKEKKLSQAEKRLAKRSYELEKQAANQPKNIYSFFPNAGQRNFAKPIASVRPMQSEIGSRLNPQLQNRSKWIPAEVWQKQGMSAQEMTLPLDVVIPTSSPDKTSIVLKAGQRVMVLKSPKGIYMQLENGKIIAIRSAFKVGQNGPGGSNKADDSKKEGSVTITPTLKSNNIGIPQKITPSVRPGILGKQQFLKPFNKVPDKKVPVNMTAARSRQVLGKAKPFVLNRKFESVTPDVKQRLLSGKISLGNQGKFSTSEQSGSEDGSSIEGGSESNIPEETIIDSSDEKTEEKEEEEKPEPSNSLDTLRKVTESISDSSSRGADEGDGRYPQMNPLKNYRHNFASQNQGPMPNEERKKEVEVESIEPKSDGNSTAQQQQPQQQQTQQQQQGNENVQNWLMNQSYPPVDPYGNYFPGYYGYGPGPGPMVPPYEGFYPPGNYPRNPSGKQSGENTKGSTQTVQPPTTQNNPTTVNTPPVYPPYPNPYAYPYNYPGNFNNQGFPFSNQSQSGQQQQQPQQPPPTQQQQVPQQSQSQQPSQQLPPSSNPPQNSQSNQNQQFYDNSMYSAFHRPEAPFQNSENSYPNPYPRPPYPNNGAPGFFPYNHPYPNYPYGPNFNPYMPPGYGYPVQQNQGSVNNQSQSANENAPGNNGNNNNSTSANS